MAAYVAMIGASFVAIGVTADVTARSTRPPATEFDSGSGAYSLRHRLLSIRQVVFYGAITSLGIGSLLAGRLEHNIELMAGGILALAAAAAVLIRQIRHARNSRLVLTPKGLRIRTQQCDWEFPWASVTEFDADLDSPDGAITIRCPVTEMISRRTAGEPPSKWLPPYGSSDGPWRIPSNWGNNDNCLLSTLRYFQEHPEKLGTLSSSELTAMLTPPSWETRKQLARTHRAQRRNSRDGVA
ncbi:hypothetical protein ACIA8C_11645 [Nocardia sp. NPDC051321]|uniref:hypothetical protein n=1 Tax=Nocardia sp. NPDC051321 TaxID=3364323 RepID=UPI003798FF5C